MTTVQIFVASLIGVTVALATLLFFLARRLDT